MAIEVEQVGPWQLRDRQHEIEWANRQPGGILIQSQAVLQHTDRARHWRQPLAAGSGQQRAGELPAPRNAHIVDREARYSTAEAEMRDQVGAALERLHRPQWNVIDQAAI